MCNKEPPKLEWLTLADDWTAWGDRLVQHSIKNHYIIDKQSKLLPELPPVGAEEFFAQLRKTHPSRFGSGSSSTPFGDCTVAEIAGVIRTQWEEPKPQEGKENKENKSESKRSTTGTTTTSSSTS